ncbi:MULTISPECIES: DUF192 domain-containing protein [Pseudomonas]|jgi:uncharacterized membrane protein (UPF0127 family)|uniref:DUF192 domain-containing protein n=2 Tax=Pseudomonas TaxID=286 RepID=UPI00257AE837|nr:MULTISPECIES: DUF192 domain-containing protein [Pseudomonas]
MPYPSVDHIRASGIMPYLSLCFWTRRASALRRRDLSVILGVLIASVEYAQAFERKSVQVGIHTVTVEVADTASKREQGLMHRHQLPEMHGMLFVFDEPKKVCFWMHDTILPLSIAFLDARGRIVDIQDMEPLSEDLHCAPSEVTQALEMNKGWFRRQGVKTGDQVQGL